MPEEIKIALVFFGIFVISLPIIHRKTRSLEPVLRFAIFILAYGGSWMMTFFVCGILAWWRWPAS